ncbi:MAG TPA: hypothetical protein VHL14_04415, partial [Steroidobacteraceae bacterium]|nr:hypothetical protein [Steroidobacteraceae bacterium]
VAPVPPVTRPISATWWGHRWIAALEHTSRDVIARLGRGRAYARDGHVHDLHIKPGAVTALVSDDELENYSVALKLDVFDNKTWQQIILNMHQQAIFVAQLLNGEMPKEINTLFRACGKSLFPINSHDIDSDCGCDDWANPCKHVAATHYVLGEALDTDPFLLFELRGRTKEQVLAALSQLRSAEPGLPAPKAVVQGSSVALEELSVNQFEQGVTAVPALHFDFDSTVAAGALLKSLGKPSSWQIDETPTELFLPTLTHAREYALAIANGTQATTSAISSSTVKPLRSKKPRSKKPATEKSD